MLLLPGSPALSSFRLDKLLSAVQARYSGVTAIAARWYHVVDLERELDVAERGILDRLLTYGPRLDVGDLSRGILSEWS